MPIQYVGAGKPTRADPATGTGLPSGPSRPTGNSQPTGASQSTGADPGPSRTRGIVLALFSAASFSTLGIFAELLYSRGFSVPQTLAWRFTVAASVLGLVMAGRIAARALRPGPARRAFMPKGRFPALLLLGLFGFSPQAGMFFLTVRMLDPGITSLLLYLYPSFVIVFSLVFFRKRPGKGQAIALVLSLAGCLLTFFRAGQYPMAGMMLGVIVAVTYAAYLVWGERILAGVDPIAATSVIMAVAAVVYWTWTLAAPGSLRIPADSGSWLAIAGVAVLATVIPVTTLFASMRMIGAADVSLVSTIEPVCTVLLSVVIFGETLTLPRIAGGLLICAAVVVIRFSAPAGPVVRAGRGRTGRR